MPTLTNEQVLAQLHAAFTDAIRTPEEPYGMLTIYTTAEALLPLLAYVKEDSVLQMNFLTSITAVHYPHHAGAEFTVVYHCHSWVTGVRLRIKVQVPLTDPTVPTAVSIHECANWMERETFDNFGINFSGHPNLVRILNMDDMDYHPLRKEYPLEDPTRNDKVDLQFGR